MYPILGTIAKITLTLITCYSLPFIRSSMGNMGNCRFESTHTYITTCDALELTAKLS